MMDRHLRRNCSSHKRKEMILRELRSLAADHLLSLWLKFTEEMPEELAKPVPDGICIEDTGKCFDKDANYNATLRGIFSFHNNKTGEIKEQQVFICELPMMTKNGTFVVNGVERVVVNQLVRAPGVYFTKGEKRTANENAFMVKLIPYRGAWLRYEYDVKTASYQVRMDSPRRVLKIPMMDFLRALGFTYPGENRPALEDVSLKLGATTRIAIVGAGFSPSLVLAERDRSSPARTPSILPPKWPDFAV